MAFEFDDEDREQIKLALASKKFDWSSQDLASVKKKIKNTIKAKWSEQCCYCRRGMEDMHNFDIDIEHILPSSQFSELAFEFDNLNLSCKRCNMIYKGSKVDFVVDMKALKVDYKHSRHYKFIHPNFDPYEKNLKRLGFFVDEVKFTKYLPLTDKGTYTYTYFKLNKIERNQFDEVQGVENSLDKIDAGIPEDKLTRFYEFINDL